MKKLVLLVSMFALAACDRPQYDVQLVCEDGAKGQLLVDAQFYKSHADLTIKRLTKELRAKAQHRDNMWLADHTWLYNQIPQIDDITEITLNATEYGDYEMPGKIKMELNRDRFTGGLKFTLWHAADNNLMMRDGKKIPDGEYMVGVSCEPVFDSTEPEPQNISAEIKNCMAYVSSQLIFDNTQTEKRILVYDENTGREMYIGEEAINKIFNGIEPYHFYFVNAEYYPDDALSACDVAARLREYIGTHIDSEYIPEPTNLVSVSPGQTIITTCGDDDIVIRGE